MACGQQNVFTVWTVLSAGPLDSQPVPWTHCWSPEVFPSYLMSPLVTYGRQKLKLGSRNVS